MNAVIYARYSSHGQTEQSIEGQLHVCQEYARKQGYNILENYIDRAKSGTKDNRPEFQRMLQDSEKQLFKYVIVYQFDRFGRNIRNSLNNKFNLKKNGVKVISAIEPTSDTPMNIVFESYIDSFAEYFSLDLSRKSKRGIRESVLKGNYIGGPILFGYKVIDKKVHIDEERAEFIRYYFNERALGRSRKDIVDELKSRGVLSFFGKGLSYNSFQNAEKNRKYIGEFYFDGQIYTNMYPPIIDKETFLKVQNIKSQVKHSNRAKIDYILTGKLFCGHCGSAMVGTAGTSRHGNRHYYYSCSKRYKEKKCDKKTEKKDFIEWYVCEQTVNYILEPERKEYIAVKLIDVFKNDYTSQKIKYLEKEIKIINKEVDKLTNEYIGAPQLIKDRISEKVKIIEIQLFDLKNELEKVQSLSKVKLTKDDIEAWLNTFAFGDLENEEFRKKIISTFINSIYLYDDKILMYFNVSGSELVSYTEMLSDVENLNIEDDNETSYNAIGGVHMGNPMPRHSSFHMNPRYIFKYTGVVGIYIKR